MYKANKSISISSLVIGLLVLFLACFLSTAAAEENYGNLSIDPNMMGMIAQESIDLPFDPNNYTFLIYNPGGTQSRIVSAMDQLGIPYDERGPGNEVTANDLTTHDILIVGWNDDGSTAGLTENVLAAGITGRVILSGHDADFHTVHGSPEAEVFLVQAIDYVLEGVDMGIGTGMITLGCTGAFPYLPEEWDVNALFISDGEIVSEFTPAALASGVYDGLEPIDMCNWGTSYHDVFIIDQNSVFVKFELGGDGDDIITVARLWSGYGVELTKTDDVNDGNSVLPGDYITYEITYGPNGYSDANVVITDYLPVGVDPNNLSDPNYDIEKHTYTWQIGSLDANDPNDSVTLTVKVNEGADPNGIITNYCEIESETACTPAILGASVCCWGGDIIYVDGNCKKIK